MSPAAIFGLGILTGIIITNIIFRSFLVGILHVDTTASDDTPYMFLELSKGVRAVAEKTHILLKVHIKDSAPHK